MIGKLPERLLLVAHSARMLAQSAARAGLRTVTLDMFADEDTRHHAERCRAIPVTEQGFDEDALLAAADQLAPAGSGTGLIYGGGIDSRPGLLQQLARGRILLGNSPDALRRIKTPRAFFKLLDELDIPYPRTRFSPPESPAGWLVKSGCREGGKGVRFCAKNCPAGADHYYQRRMEGEALSALFLADGENARIIGFNTQWTANHDPDQPFLFAGAVNRAELGGSQRAQIEQYSGRLTRAAGLIGLNSLDFMPDGNLCRVLEINPRPSATLALYDPDYAKGLLFEHIAACRGELSAHTTPRGLVRAFRIVYAPRAIVISERLAWPRWCADRPSAGTAIRAGEPLCTVQAEGEDRRETEALLKTRETEIQVCLGLLP